MMRGQEKPSPRDEALSSQSRLTDGALEVSVCSQGKCAEREDLGRVLFERAREGIALVDPVTKRFQETNAVFQELLGYSGEELAGQTLYDVVVQDQTNIDLDVQQILEQGHCSLGEREYRHKDGSFVALDVCASVINHHGRELLCTFVLDVAERGWVFREIRRQAEALAALHDTALDLARKRALPDVLQAILARAVSLLQAKGGGVFLYRPTSDDLEFVFVHNMETALVGITVQRDEGLAGKVLQSGRSLSVADYSCWEGRSKKLERAGITASLGVPIQWGNRMLGVLNLVDDAPRLFSTQEITLLERFAPLAAAALEGARLLEAERQRNAELEALRQASLRLTSCLELQPVLDAILECALQLVHADNAHVFLYDGQALTFGAALWADGPREEPYSMPRQDGLTYTVARRGERLVIPRADEHPLFQDWGWRGTLLGLPLRLGGKVVGVMNVAIEQPHVFQEDELQVLELLSDQAAISIQNAHLYSDLRQQMEKLKSTQGQLIRSARMAAIGDLAAGVAHELNNPLTSVLGFSELLLEELCSKAPCRQDLETIIVEARRAHDIVSNLLDFARQIQPRRQLTNINEVVQDTLILIGEHLKKSGVAIEEHYAPDLDPLLMDEGQLKQVFLSIITNAVQAMPSGGKLTVRTDRVQDEVIIAISDTGAGIPPEVQGRLFEPFFSTKPGAPGLGLSVSLGIVQEHGGKITVESGPGQGATFTVWLPRQTVEREAEGRT